MSQEFERVADSSEVPVGQMKIVKVSGQDVVIANVSGQFFAFTNKCTHVGGPLGRGKLIDNIVQCPWHGSKFDVKTGAVVGPPARTPIQTFEVKVENTNVLVRKSV